MEVERRANLRLSKDKGFAKRLKIFVCDCFTWHERTLAMEDSVDFLRHIFDLLNEGGVFDVHSDEQKAIVDFKHPEELKVNIW